MIHLLINLIRILLRLIPVTVILIALYRNPGHLRLKKAGYKEKDVTVGDVRFHYAESSDTEEPVMVLLHGEMMDWFSYHRVMTALCDTYHVYVPDLPGHGKTRCPDDYEMNAGNIGSSLAKFIEEVIGRPVIICGNSAGGLLAVWLAANKPDLIRCAVLEDPPLFSSEYPAIRKTNAYRKFIISDKAVKEDNEGDFLLFWLKNTKDFYGVKSYPSQKGMLGILIMITRMLHWQKTVEIPFVSELIREMARGMDQYDPHFGQAFYDGTWNTGFSHAEALQKITCPVLLIQADTSFLPDGTLNGAMSQENAEFALSRLRNGRLVHVQARHVVHLEAPETYLKEINAFLRDIEKAEENRNGDMSAL